MYASLGGEGPPLHELLAFRGLCETGCGGPHGDGWGVVGYSAPESPRILGRAPAAAMGDPAFEQAASHATGYPVVLAHLRAASSGLRTLENTHPFVTGAWAFAHNGTIRGGYEQRFGRPGMNDSRTLFARVHGRLRQGPEAALRAAVREVHDGKFPYTSITVLMTDGRRLLAARDVREEEDVYTMRWTEVAGRLVFCQEPVFDAAWRDVPNGHLAVASARGVDVAPL
jgi:glutamine amidotransferase